MKAFSACKDKHASLQDRGIFCRGKKIYKNWQQTSKEFPKIFFLSTFFPQKMQLGRIRALKMAKATFTRASLLSQKRMAALALVPRAALDGQ